MRMHHGHHDIQLAVRRIKTAVFEDFEVPEFQIQPILADQIDSNSRRGPGFGPRNALNPQAVFPEKFHGGGLRPFFTDLIGKHDAGTDSQF